VEVLNYPGASNSLAVDDEWSYMQSGFGVFRAPKRAGNGPIRMSTAPDASVGVSDAAVE
jgi:hypothetical protein